MKVTILGCGGSSGVPLIGNQWGACDPTDPRNRRSRASVLVETAGVTLLIDSSPDVRAQLLAAGTARIDAVLYTHDHADHTHGIDELREVNRLVGRPIDIFGNRSTIDRLAARFGYCLTPLPPDVTFFPRPVLTPHVVDGPFRVGAVEVVPFDQDHGYSWTLGYRIGGFAYSTDVKRLDESAFAALEGIEVWVVDCVRIEPAHPVHAHLALTLSWIDRVRPRLAYLTHMNHTVDYRALAALLPPGVAPAYDGLVIELAD